MSTNHLYTDLAWLWPLWGDPATEYAAYSEFVSGLIRAHAQRPVKRLLDVSCGGGKNIYTLKKHFTVTGLDLSPQMLQLAAELNPECEFITGDMRTFDLGRRFDAILVDDGISYMTSRQDLAAALTRCSHHLEPGGVMIVTPDTTSESFQQNRTTSTIGQGSRDGKPLEVTFIENLYDPDPTDEHYEATMLYLIREQGRLRIENDHFTLGVFSLETWESIIAAVGLTPHQTTFRQDDDVYNTFACV